SLGGIDLLTETTRMDPPPRAGTTRAEAPQIGPAAIDARGDLVHDAIRTDAVRASDLRETIARTADAVAANAPKNIASAVPAVAEPVPVPPPAPVAAPAPALVTPAPAPAMAPPPAPPAASSAPSVTAAAKAPLPNDEQLVTLVLQRYRQAYEGLDAPSAHAVWPGVNQAALARAFDGLESQSLTFDACDVNVKGAAAAAT